MGNHEATEQLLACMNRHEAFVLMLCILHYRS